MPSFILIHPTVWPQYTNVSDRQDSTGQDRADRQTERQHRAKQKRSLKKTKQAEGAGTELARHAWQQQLRTAMVLVKVRH